MYFSPVCYRANTCRSEILTTRCLHTVGFCTTLMYSYHLVSILMLSVKYRNSTKPNVNKRRYFIILLYNLFYITHFVRINFYSRFGLVNHGLQKNQIYVFGSRHDAAFLTTGCIRLNWSWIFPSRPIRQLRIHFCL